MESCECTQVHPHPEMQHPSEIHKGEREIERGSDVHSFHSTKGERGERSRLRLSPKYVQGSAEKALPRLCDKIAFSAPFSDKKTPIFTIFHATYQEGPIN